ncbi:hypothetical protein ACFLUF_02495 [Chloroflexota bacterium]
MFIVAKGFEFAARFSAQHEGLPDLALASLPQPGVPLPKEIEESGLGGKIADEVIEGLTQRQLSPPETKETAEETLAFDGEGYEEAVENMEKYFLQHYWSDGFPLVPPTEEAVNRMLEGAELPRDHVVGVVEPEAAAATVEKIAINAVMAGCLPQYMPVLIAAVEAITDPKFDLRGVQCTAGLVSPLMIVSGQKFIKQLNINDSFSTIGPGWRANATIGRAVRLIMFNIGNSWPGKNDMKSFGTPFKYVILMAENEGAYLDAWEPIRMAEGFNNDQPTISVMPAVSWQPELFNPDEATTDKIVELLSRQAKVKYDCRAVNWGFDNLVLLNPTAFEAIFKEGRSRIDIQRALYESIKVPCAEFFGGKEPATALGPIQLPESFIEQCREDPKALVPLLPRPESVKIVVAGGPGPRMMAYISTWGFGPSYFVTKPINLPKQWESLLAKYSGWNTSVVYS